MPAVQDFNVVDPFTQIYVALRNIVLNDPVLTTAISTAKFPDMTDPNFSNAINLASLNSADAPRVYLVQGKFSIVPFGPNALQGQFIQTYPLITVFKDQRIVLGGAGNISVNQYKWRMMVAMGKAGPSLGLNQLVQKFWMDDAADDLFGHPEMKQMQDRWMTILNIRVQGYIDRRLYGIA